MNRNTWAAALASIAVIVVLILGFRVLGGPGRQRLVRSDQRRVQLLAELAQQIKAKWQSSDRVLPASLDEFPRLMTQDPFTAKPFTYRPKSNGQYELCATFATNSRELSNPSTADPWAHPQGDYCFRLDASMNVPLAPYYYY